MKISISHFFLFSSVLILGACTENDYSFGGLEPDSIRLVLSDDGNRAWKMTVQEVGDTPTTFEACESDDVWVFVEAGAADSLVQWSTDSSYCSYTKLSETDSIGDVPIWKWDVQALGSPIQLTTDTLFLVADEDTVYRFLVEASTIQFSWKYFDLNDNKDTIWTKEVFEQVDLEWPPGGE